MRYIAELTTAEKYTLNEAYHKHPKFSVRQRAQALLWNAEGYTITQVYKLLDVRRETMSAWFDRWESLGIVGLFDEHRSGRPSTFDPVEQAQFLTFIDDNPHQPKKAAVQLLEQTGKQSNFTSVVRLGLCR